MFQTTIQLKWIGKSADDLRFFILAGGMHAGGITIHSVSGGSFSYGVAITPSMRRKGIAKAALGQLFELMRQRGFGTVQVQIAPGNAASIALHTSLGFAEIGRDEQQITLEKAL